MTPGSTPARRAGSRAGPWLGGLLVVAVAATFANALGNGFVYDDQLVIVDDPAVRLPLSAGFEGLQYRPLRTLSYRLDHAVGGMNPTVFHATSVAYHAGTALAVLALLGAIGASPGAALAGAVVFAVHPVQADAVTYAAGRRDVLCGLFYALGVVAFLRYRRGRGGAALLAAGVAYVLAILAKEMAITLPVAAVLMDRWRGERSEPLLRGRTLAVGAALVLVGVLALAATYGAHVVHLATERPWHGGSFPANVATVARVWTKYLQLVIWPSTLSVDYSYDAFPVSTTIADPRALASVAVLAALAALAWASFVRGGRLGLGLAWMAITLAPVSHLIPFRELLAEHYLYIPMMGVAIVVSGGVDAARVRWPERQRAVAAVVVLAVVALGVRTVVRNRDWRDRTTLWTATVAVVPRCARAQFNLGQAYFERNRFGEAEKAWLAADAIQPGDPGTSRGLASLYYRLGRYDEAATRVDVVLAALPGDGDAIALAGWIALDRGRPERALAYFDQALAVLAPEKSEGARRGRERAALAQARTGNTAPAGGLGGAR